MDALPSLPAAAEAPSEPPLRALDRLTLATIGQLTGGLSPASMALAFIDWSAHLAVAPGHRAGLAMSAWQSGLDLLGEVVAPAAAAERPVPLDDKRFRDPAWRNMPFRLWARSFLAAQAWWREATHDVPGVSAHHEAVAAFVARQILDTLSPGNLPWANPEVLRRTLETGGANLAVGATNLCADVARLAAGAPPHGAERFVVGRDVAATKGKVIHRNRLIELIQYLPATASVHPEPILIVPAWIMKYYILDLSPHNSLIRTLVEAGHTVFCISWRNVTAADCDISFDDYLRLGVMTALDRVGAVTPGERVHAVGYCLGGTLAAIAAAAMARDGDARLATLTLFAAQTDFTEPGELGLFIDESAVAVLDSMMWETGTLIAAQMGNAFRMLRSNDLVWSKMVREYLLGERTPLTDLMAWNADATRMPHRMQAEYLRKLLLGNDLAAGRYEVGGRAVALQDIRVPLFAVGTEGDHVAPWRSVYKIHHLADTEVTFVLTGGGHNAGIVAAPDDPRWHFRIMTTPADVPRPAPDDWLARAARRSGSWWPAWMDWLAAHSGPPAPPPALGARACATVVEADAPGRYALER